MFPRIVLCVLLALGFSSECVSQQGSAPSAVPQTSVTSEVEFPVILQQKIVAGKTPPGTHIQANLVAATLVNGTVIPRSAVLSGEVIESKAKTSSDPSRLSIRMDSAQWKGGSAPVQVYLTSWFYPVTMDSGPNLQYGPDQSGKGSWNGMGEYPTRSPSYKPFPSDSDKDNSSTNASSSVPAKHPVTMKDTTCERDSTGVITLIGHHSNLKLDTLATYVFGSSELVTSTAH
jgi:hypothetical protein